MMSLREANSFPNLPIGLQFIQLNDNCLEIVNSELIFNHRKDININESTSMHVFEREIKDLQNITSNRLLIIKMSTILGLL